MIIINAHRPFANHLETCVFKKVFITTAGVETNAPSNTPPDDKYCFLFSYLFFALYATDRCKYPSGREHQKVTGSCNLNYFVKVSKLVMTMPKINK